MTKRKLTSDEIKLCERNIKFLKNRNSLIRPKVIHYDYLISYGLKASMEEENQKALDKKREIYEELHRNDMTIIQLVQEMKTKETFAPCFLGANSGGSGKAGSSETGSNKKEASGKEKPEKTVDASDSVAVSKNLESIASGETQVNMSD